MALALARFVAAEAGTVGIVRMVVFVVAAAAGGMVAGRMAEAAGVAVIAVGMVRKVS